MAGTFDPSKVIIMANAHDTLKNDGYETTSVTIPGSVSVSGGSSYIGSADLTMGTAGAMLDARFQTSANSSVDYLASVQNSFSRSGSLGPYSIFVDVFRVAPTTVRAQVLVSNPSGGSMTGQASAETFTFKIRSFRAPF